MKTLMECLDTKKVRRGTASCNGTTALPKDGRSVVCTGVDRALPNVNKGGISILLNDGAGELQIGIVNGALRIGIRHQIVDNIRWETSSPEVRNWIRSAKGEDDPAHAWSGGIVSTINHRGQLN
jgi:hypothetical protein